MLKKITFIIIFLLFNGILFAQSENYPIYKGCENEPITNMEKCFMEKVKSDFFKKYTKPSDANEYQNEFYVVFIANKDGKFDVIHVSSNSVSVNRNVEKTFSELDDFQPATINGQTIDKQFILYYPDVKKRSLQEVNEEVLVKDNSLEINKNNTPSRLNLNYFDNNQTHNYLNSENIHTAFKPYISNLVADAHKIDSINNTLKFNKTSWWGRKFWNENFVEIQEKNYWIHINPLVDLQVGKDNSDNEFTYNNTRAARVEAGLWNKVVLSSSIYESQGRFADYFNRYAFAIKPGTDGSAIVPGQGNSKGFGTNGFDYPVATGYVSYSPNKTFNFQMGRDKNFIGDGYRSVFLSDVATAPTFFKIQTNFWKIQYTNLWLWLRDVRSEVIEDGIFKRKFVAIHHLSWNATPKLNVGLFESVVWSKTANQGFDVDYLNPIILFRPIEFALGSKRGNAMIGFNANYKFNKDVNLYSQILFDEITMKEMFGSKGYWANKYAFQLGVKYFNALKIPNLTLQAEYNMVRPYTYSHNNIETNYGTYNQSLAHPWGSNFREGVFIADYTYQRWFANAKLTMGIKGFDYNSSEDSFSYGGDIYRDYTDRNANYDIKTGQGNKANISIGEIQAGYLINPATNLKLFVGLLVREFDAPVENQIFKNGTTTWFTFGLKSDLNNWYFDF